MFVNGAIELSWFRRPRQARPTLAVRARYVGGRRGNLQPQLVRGEQRAFREKLAKLVTFKKKKEIVLKPRVSWPDRHDPWWEEDDVEGLTPAEIELESRRDASYFNLPEDFDEKYGYFMTRQRMMNFRIDYKRREKMLRRGVSFQAKGRYQTYRARAVLVSRFKSLVYPRRHTRWNRVCRRVGSRRRAKKNMRPTSWYGFRRSRRLISASVRRRFQLLRRNTPRSKKPRRLTLAYFDFFHRYRRSQRLRMLSVSLNRTRFSVRRWYRKGKLVMLRHRLPTTSKTRKSAAVLDRKLVNQTFRTDRFYFRRHLINRGKSLFRRRRRRPRRTKQKNRRRAGRRRPARRSWYFPRHAVAGRRPTTSRTNRPNTTEPIWFLLAKNKNNFFGVVTHYTKVLLSVSAGQLPYTRGSRRGTPYAAGEVAIRIAQYLKYTFVLSQKHWQALAKPRPRVQTKPKKRRRWSTQKLRRLRRRSWIRSNFKDPQVNINLVLKNWSRRRVWKTALRQFFRTVGPSRHVRVKVIIRHRKTHNGMRRSKERRV